MSVPIGFGTLATSVGCDPIGSADCLAEINAALADLTGTGGVLLFTNGTFKVSAPITNPSNVPIMLEAGATFTGAGASSVTAGAYTWPPARSPVVPNVYWTQTDWYVDPVAGLDTNPGTIGSPVKTIMGGIVAKWGTTTPTLKQTTTIHLVSSETAGQEYVILEPVVVGGANLIVDGAAGLVLKATFNLGVVIPKDRATGTLLSSTGFVAAGLAAGQLVVNNVTGGHAFIQALAGGTATLSQPLAHLSPQLYPAPAEDDAWAGGQSVSVYVVPLLNLERFAPYCGDSTDGVSNGFVWLNAVYVPDLGGGAPGNSYWFPSMADALTTLQDCAFDPYVACNNGTLSHDGGHFLNCAFNGGGQVFQASVCGGYTALYPLGIGLDADVDLDHIAAAGIDPFGPRCFIGYCYVPASTPIFLYPDTSLIIDDNLNGTAGAALYGGAGLTVGTKSAVLNRSGETWVNCLLLTGTLKLVDTTGPITTGSAFDGGAAGNPFTPGIAITAANLDTYGGLQNPVTDARFAIAEGP